MQGPNKASLTSSLVFQTEKELFEFIAYALKRTRTATMKLKEVPDDVRASPTLSGRMSAKHCRLADETRSKMEKLEETLVYLER